MASIRKRPNGKYRARYRDSAGKEHARHFDRKKDAEQWLTGQQSSLLGGTWVDPARGRVPVREFAPAWLKSKLNLKPSTSTRYSSIIDQHILPTWGNVQLVGVDHEGVASWVGQLVASGLSPSSVRQCYRVFHMILAAAVTSRRITINPAEGVELPRVSRADKRFLTAVEVARLADAAGECRTVVLALAYTGLRFGELAALRVRRVDLPRRRLEIAESVTEINGKMVTGAPKTHRERRVPIGSFLVELIAPGLEGKGPDDLVFTTPLGSQLRSGNFRRYWFDPAASSVGLEGLTPHELRHTAASLAISSGANVKDVQKMLGHESAAVTLDIYSGLFEDSLDDVADRMDAMARAAADSVRTADNVTALPGVAASL